MCSFFSLILLAKYFYIFLDMVDITSFQLCSCNFEKSKDGPSIIVITTVPQVSFILIFSSCSFLFLVEPHVSLHFPFKEIYWSHFGTFLLCLTFHHFLMAALGLKFNSFMTEVIEVYSFALLHCHIMSSYSHCSNLLTLGLN